MASSSLSPPSSSSSSSSLSEDDARLRFCPIAMNTALETNVRLVQKLTGMETGKVRYSLSGSEAVDAALKDIKASTNKSVVVRFQSAYHGHVSGISFLDCGPHHVFLPECDDSSLDFIERYHYRIAAVIVNPMQHFTGVNKPSPPGEKLSHTRRVRSGANVHIPRDDYARWLHSLQRRCNYCTEYLTKVAFVTDDIYFAFRTPELTSANYFRHPETDSPLRPDVTILGKGVAAGYPLSVVAGRHGFLNHYDKKFLLKLNKTVGTLAAWHGGIVASNVFLQTLLEEPATKPTITAAITNTAATATISSSAKHQLECLVQKCDAFTTGLNDRFNTMNLPLRMRNFSNTFSVDYLNKSLYNSRYPQYLQAEGLFLGNYTTGKFNLNADIHESDIDFLIEKFVSAATKMNEHGYFEAMTGRKRLLFYASLAGRFVKNYAKIYYDQIMEDKHIDIQVSHNHPVNKAGHFWSSVGMILFAYPLLFYHGDTVKGCAWFFGTHVVRQAGHFFYEHQDRNVEKRKFGHKDASKKEAVAFLLCAYVAYVNRADLYALASNYIDDVYLDLTFDQYVAVIALFTVVPHFVEICYQYGLARGLSWAIKILTDPFTDILDFYTHAVIHPKWFLDLKDHRATYQLDLTTKEVSKVEEI